MSKIYSHRMSSFVFMVCQLMFVNGIFVGHVMGFGHNQFPSSFGFPNNPSVPNIDSSPNAAELKYLDQLVQKIANAIVRSTLVINNAPHIKAQIDMEHLMAEIKKSKINEFFEPLVEAITENMGRLVEELNKDLAKNVIPETKETARQFLSTLFNKRNMLQIGLPVAGTLALIITGLYGTRLLWLYLQHRLINPKPKVLLPGSHVGHYDRWKRHWIGYKSPAMVFTDAVKDRLTEIVEKTKNIKKHIKEGKKATYDNLLLYGEPGTGKTLFATILADLTDMDFAATTAGALLQSGAGVKYLNELMDMAERSKYGLILFLDEADAFFVDRASLDPASEHYQVLNHLLALTGDGSSKFMLIAATNHAYVMDEAMGRRFQDRVHMPLPDASTRQQIVELYANTVLYNEKNNGTEFVESIQQLLTPVVVQELVTKTEGLSNAEIKDIVCAMHKKALATENGLPTMHIITSALTEGLEKKQALLADRKEREAKEARKVFTAVAA